MLNFLRIQNVALISVLEVNFGAHLNILSGETGAGKSIIIDSINFVLGERPGKDFIRSGESTAEVEALMTVHDEHTLAALRGLGVPMEDDNAVLLFRSLTDANKSVCRVNGRVVTIGMLKEISAQLIDIHGQHEHQSLLNPARHIELLDRFCGEALDRLKADAAAQFRHYREIVKQIKTLSGDEADRAAKVDLYAFQIREIEAANLKPNEDELLDARKQFLGSAEKLSKAANDALAALYGGEGGGSALDMLAAALSPVETLAAIDDSQTGFAESIRDMHARLDDLLRDFRRYCGNLESDPQELDRVEARLDVIYKLRKKYGASVSEILDYAAQTKQKLDAIENSGEALESLHTEKAALEKELVRLSAQMSARRKAAAQNIEKEIEAVLRDLGMKSAAFSIAVERKKELSPSGFDKIEFLIAPNSGEPMKPLSQIASGGEMSRVMLALKTALADCDHIETFIFDEIDTGVSGRTAQQVAEKLAAIGRSHQILCITHLPQIAAMGDTHFLIEKQTDGSRTLTSVQTLAAADSIRELARLTSGAQITDTSLRAAAEMKELADAFKARAFS